MKEDVLSTSAITGTLSKRSMLDAGRKWFRLGDVVRDADTQFMINEELVLRALLSFFALKQHFLKENEKSANRLIQTIV